VEKHHSRKPMGSLSLGNWVIPSSRFGENAIGYKKAHQKYVKGIWKPNISLGGSVE
jgi:hypothetical protein